MIGGDMRAKGISALVRQAKAGDDEAFGRLVEEYQDKIYNYVARMLHDRTEAQDVAQEVFIRAYENLSGFRRESSFQTWLYRIASNLTIDAARARQRRISESFSLDKPMETEEGELNRELPAPDRGPIAMAESSQLQEVVAEAIAQLSPKLKSVITLYDLQGFSYNEIAKILGCPIGTVKSRLFSARNQLQEILKSKIDIEDLLPT